MRTFGKFVESISPKFNKTMVEGLSYHRLRSAIGYIDRFIKYGCQGKTQTHLRYLGYKELMPKDELKLLFNKVSRTEYDIAENDIYLVEFYFQYGTYDEILKYHFYIPFASKGNVVHLSGNRLLVMPVFADKVISIGERIIFINILTAKYNFTRSYGSVVVGERYNRVPIINTEFYKNPSKKQDDTTGANTTVMHYLLANYGYEETMKMLLGFVPAPTYKEEVEGCVVVKSTGVPPQGYIRDKLKYVPTQIRFAIPEALYNESVLMAVGNIFYIVDNFPDIVSIADLESTVMWKRLLGEIIHSGNHSLFYLTEKINAHFNDLNSRFDDIITDKLRDVGVEASTLIELIRIIFQNFNTWIMNASPRSLYYNKTYEVESFALSNITSRITRIVLDINKEELRESARMQELGKTGDQYRMLELKAVDKIMRKYAKMRTVFSLKNERLFVASIDSSTDHHYPKNTAMVIQQESDFMNVKKQEVNTSERKKLVASMATIGSIFGLSKNNPTPLIRMNPYVNVDTKTGTVLPHPLYNHIIEATDKLLANMVLSESVDTSLLERVMGNVENADDPHYDDDMDDDNFDPDQIDID